MEHTDDYIKNNFIENDGKLIWYCHMKQNENGFWDINFVRDFYSPPKENEEIIPKKEYKRKITL